MLVLNGTSMRASTIYVLVVLLIAVFAIGSPLPAQAACDECQDCSTEAPAKNSVPCPEKGLACQIAQTCASQVQKLPAHTMGFGDLVSGHPVFGGADDIVVKLAFIKPETSPPRL